MESAKKSFSIPDYMSEFTEISSSDMALSVKYSCEGGGTGQEFTRNLFIPGNGPGNKWYDHISKGTWIQVDFKGKPRCVAMYSLKSANDCERRDPYSWRLLGQDVSSGKWEELHSVSGVKFDRRYMWKQYFVRNDKAHKALRIEIDLNRSAGEDHGWSDGTQLAEIMFFEAITARED